MSNGFFDNVSIDTILLSDIVVDLEKNNEKVISIINNIEKAYKLLDESKWKSREKERFDEQFFYYTNGIKSSFCSKLNEYPLFLKNAINLYKENQDMSMKVSDDFLNN